MTDQQPPSTDTNGEDGSPTAAEHAEATDGDAPTEPMSSTITDAAKLIRLGTMTQSLMSEAREAPLDAAGRALLAKIHGETMEALKDTISQDLLDELLEFQLCMDDNAEPPSESELRIAQAQLVGWLEGLFHDDRPFDRFKIGS